jgi:HPt (histidine-containing phosphotransfer) domain-containing protein
MAPRAGAHDDDTPQPLPLAQASVSAAVELPHLEGLDTAKGLATVAGNRALYARQLARFARTYHDFGATFAQALADADTTAPKRAAHTLRGIAGNLGAGALQRAAGLLEQACKEGVPREQLDALLQHTVQALQPLVDGLADFDPQPAPAAEASTGGADAQRIQGLLDQLASQLSHGDTDAADTMTELMPLVSEPALAASLRRIARAIEDFDFEAGEQVLQSLRGGSRGD